MSKDSQIDSLEKIMDAADEYIELLEQSPEIVNINKLREARDKFRELRRRRMVRKAAWMKRWQQEQEDKEES